MYTLESKMSVIFFETQCIVICNSDNVSKLNMRPGAGSAVDEVFFICFTVYESTSLLLCSLRNVVY